MRIPSLVFPRVVSVVMLCASACGGDRVSAPDLPFTTEAVVRFVGLEGGFYAIETIGGRHLDPTNLPVAFQQDGLAVRVSGAVRADLVGYHMYGEIFQITEIVRR